MSDSSPKTIDTLIPDIEARLVSGEPFEKEDVESFGKNLVNTLVSRLATARSRATLRASNLGTKCARKLWYSINKPEVEEPLPARARLSFLYGDILESLLLFLARAAGHKVEQEQAEIELNGIKGHIDAVIDGELVDVKSASPSSFNKFKYHTLPQEDSFGYIPQINTYRAALKKERGHFLAVDKSAGKLHLDTHDADDVDYAKLVDERREMLAHPEPPERGFQDESDGASGNRKLGLTCSYCAFKSTCFPGLRAFAYSRGPRFLTVVTREPDVPEIRLNDKTE